MTPRSYYIFGFCLEGSLSPFFPVSSINAKLSEPAAGLALADTYEPGIDPLV